MHKFRQIKKKYSIKVQVLSFIYKFACCLVSFSVLLNSILFSYFVLLVLDLSPFCLLVLRAFQHDLVQWVKTSGELKARKMRSCTVISHLLSE